MQRSKYLKVSNFGFAIPTGATIEGVQVGIRRHGSGQVKDKILRLAPYGTADGNNYAATSTVWETSDKWVYYGGANDVWGFLAFNELTPAILNDSTFAVVLSVTANNTGSSSTAYVDAFSVTVYYTNQNNLSNYLKVTNFGFTLPAGATINGVVVDINKHAGMANNVTDTVVKLVKGGVVSGNNKASGSAWGTSDTYATYGGATDTWGVTLLYTDVNDPTFGVVISCSAASVPETAFIEHVRVTVYYTDSAFVSPVNFNGYGFQNDGQYEYTQGVLYSQTASKTVSNTTAETSLVQSGRGTVTLPANFLTAGKTIRLTAYGIYSTTGTPNLRFRVKLGSTFVGTTGNVATANNVSNQAWKVECVITCRSVGVSGTTYTIGFAMLNTSGTNGVVWDMEAVGTDTIDTTSPLTLDLLAAWGTANASNTLTCSHIIIEAVG